MTDAVWIAVISNATTIIAIIVSRLLSHFEHRSTSSDVREIKRLVNGQGEKPHE